MLSKDKNDAKKHDKYHDKYEKIKNKK